MDGETRKPRHKKHFVVIVLPREGLIRAHAPFGELIRRQAL